MLNFLANGIEDSSCDIAHHRVEEEECVTTVWQNGVNEILPVGISIVSSHRDRLPLYKYLQGLSAAVAAH